MGLYAIEDDQLFGNNDDNYKVTLENDGTMLALENEIFFIDQLVITDCMKARASLENYAESINFAANNGGMNRDAIMLAQVGLNSISSFMGASQLGDRAFPALESYSNTGSNLNVLRFAVEESITETLKRWWKNIKDKIMSWVKKVTDFWHTKLGNAARMRNNAASLAKKAGERSSWTTDKSTIDISPGDYRNLSVDGKISIEPGLKALKVLIEEADKLTATKDAVKVMTEKLKDLKFGTAEELAESVKQVDLSYPGKATTISLYSKVFPGGPKDDLARYPKNDSAFTMISSDGIIGDKIVRVTFSTFTKFDAVSAVDIALDDYTKDYKLNSSDQKLDALTSDKIVSLCGVIEDLAKSVVDLRTNIGAIETENKTLIDAADKVIADISANKAKFSDNDKQTSAINSCKAKVAVVGKLVANTYQPAQSYHSQAGASWDAAYNYAVKSYNNLKKP